jgi:SanA protein
MKKKLIIITAVMLGLFTIVIVVINNTVATKYSDRIYDIKSVPAKNVGLILGAQVWGNETVSDILEDRILAGIELYKQGKIKKLIMSGDHGAKDYDEVNNMKRFAISNGVKAQDIFMDHAGFRTYDSCYRARDIFGVNSMVIITNEFHLPRALYIANKMGIDAIGVKSDTRKYASAGYNNIREFFARVKAFIDVDIMKPNPKFLGGKIDIKGDGTVTQD